MRQQLLEKYLNRAKQENRDRDLVAQAMSNGASSLGGSLDIGSAGYIPRQQAPMNIGVGYSNVYGTDLNVSFDPTTQQISGRAVIPVGDARSGLSFEASGSYDARSQSPSGFIGFRKKNVSTDRQIAEQQLGLNDPSRDKYAYGVSLNDGSSGQRAIPAGGSMQQLPPGYMEALQYSRY